MSNGEGKETVFCQNAFGTVTDKRITYYRERGRFSGGSREDVPLRHVTSVGIEKIRNIIGGIISIVIGIPLLFFVVGIIPIAWGLILLWGSPLISVATAAGQSETMLGWPWHYEEAQRFVNAVRSQLFTG